MKMAAFKPPCQFSGPIPRKHNLTGGDASLPNRPTRSVSAKFRCIVELHLGFFGIHTLRCCDIILCRRTPNIKLVGALGEEIALIIGGKISGRCDTCRRYSRGYLRHLYTSGEILASRLHTLHNLTYYLDLMKRIRDAIETGGYAEFRDAFLAGPEADQ